MNITCAVRSVNSRSCRRVTGVYRKDISRLLCCGCCTCGCCSCCGRGCGWCKRRFRNYYLISRKTGKALVPSVNGKLINIRKNLVTVAVFKNLKIKNSYVKFYLYIFEGKERGVNVNKPISRRGYLYVLKEYFSFSVEFFYYSEKKLFCLFKIDCEMLKRKDV